MLCHVKLVCAKGETRKALKCVGKLKFNEMKNKIILLIGIIAITSCEPDFKEDNFQNKIPETINIDDNKNLKNGDGWGLNQMLMYSHGGYFACYSPPSNCFDVVDILPDNEVYSNFLESINGNSSSIASFFEDQGQDLFPGLYDEGYSEKLTYLTGGSAKIISYSDSIGTELFFVMDVTYNDNENIDSLLNQVEFVIQINEN